MKSKVLMIGCGSMGKALLSRWLDQEWMREFSFSIIKPSSPDAGWNARSDMKWYKNLQEYHESPDYILLAVKPQVMKEIGLSVKERFGTSPFYISIAAGITLDSYRHMFGGEVRIVRAMPNTPVSVGAGMTTLVSTDTVTESERAMAERLFASVGSAIWLENESQMDMTTALAGSGPAYIYIFMEALIKAGTERGLSACLAEQLVIHTMKGATLLAASSDYSLEILRRQVTSKGGITEAALQQFTDNDRLFSLVSSAMDEALIRAGALNTALSLA